MSSLSTRFYMLSLKFRPFSLPSSLKCIVKPDLSPLEHWVKIIWVAKDLKRAVNENKKKNLHLLDSKHVTLLFAKPHGRFQVAYTLACDLLGARRTLYFDPNFEDQHFPSDNGRVLSLLTDMLIFHGVHQGVLRKTITKVTVPAFSASCNVYCLHKTLSDLMTFWETHERLQGLTLAWIGPPNSTFNSYLILCSRFGMNIRYLCMCRFGAGRMSPVLRPPTDATISLKEFQTVAETVAGSNVIATSMHPEEENKITLEHLKKADPNCFFMHSLPRSPIEVSDEVFYHKNNLSWRTTENYLFIAMAVIVTSLCEYQPKSSMPSFNS